jgi:hypothetical protein
MDFTSIIVGGVGTKNSTDVILPKGEFWEKESPVVVVV